MKLDVFCETQKAAPITPDHEARVFRETLDQAVFADEAGFECWWAVEHHGALEFSWSSAPEMLLAWIATRTQRIHLGHAGVLAPFNIDHPVRAAERLAMLDHISGGRAELGLARTGAGEWDTFQVNPDTDPASQRSLALGNAQASEIPLEQDHPVVQVLRRYAAGQKVAKEEAYEALLPVPSVIIGDVATCKKKMEAYREIGATRLLCMFQYADLAHESVISSMGAVARNLIPAFAA